MDWEKRIVKSVRLFNILNLDITICFVAKNIISIQQYTDFLFWLKDGRDFSTFITSLIKISQTKLKNWQYTKKCEIASALMLKSSNWCSHYGLKANLSLVSNSISTLSQILQIFFSLGLMKFSRALWKLL